MNSSCHVICLHYVFEDDESTDIPSSVATSDDGTTPQATTSHMVATSHLNITPSKVGEWRCGTAENKVTAAQSEEEVTRQLQANMMLLTSHLLRTKAEENPANADSINVMTCYGLQLGSTYPLKIIKLTINFEECNCEYEEQFCLYPCGVYPPYIDIHSGKVVTVAVSTKNSFASILSSVHRYCTRLHITKVVISTTVTQLISTV